MWQKLSLMDIIILHVYYRRVQRTRTLKACRAEFKSHVCHLVPSASLSLSSSLLPNLYSGHNWVTHFPLWDLHKLKGLMFG